MKYFWLTLKHKWWVFFYGLKIGCPIWRLITHDISKLTPTEYPHYQRQFFGRKGNQDGFNQAWLHHQNTNDHHWEYWIPRTGHDKGTPRWADYEPMPMSEGAVKEMIADWMGASHAYGNKAVDINNWPWLDERWPRYCKTFHAKTKSRAMRILFKMGRKHLCP